MATSHKKIPDRYVPPQPPVYPTSPPYEIDARGVDHATRVRKVWQGIGLCAAAAVAVIGFEQAHHVTDPTPSHEPSVDKQGSHSEHVPDMAEQRDDVIVIQPPKID